MSMYCDVCFFNEEAAEVFECTDSAGGVPRCLRAQLRGQRNRWNGPNPDLSDRAEHGFISTEAARRGETMAAVIRGCIDDKMRVPDTAWTANPMLEPTPSDAGPVLPEDAAINHDHYLYGTPKKYLKKRGKWVLAEPEAGR